MHLQVGAYIAPHQVSPFVASSHRIVQGARDINLSDDTAPIQHKAVHSQRGFLLEKSHNSAVGINPVGLSVCTREIYGGEDPILQEKAMNDTKTLWVLGHRIRPLTTDDSYGLIEVTSSPKVPSMVLCLSR